VFNDRAVVGRGAATWDDCAMRIRTTVVSRPTATRAIIDAGSKTLSSDLLGQTGHGRVVEYPDAVIYQLNEEHGYVDLDGCPKRPDVGEIVSVIPNHTCVVTNLHDQLIGVRRGRVEVVWEVAARGTTR
jgi:D-serine deaminase-like pyridoxal phosphate-dependent protein